MLLLYLDQAGKNSALKEYNFILKCYFSSGKSTLIQELFKEFPTSFAFSISRMFNY